MTDFSLLNKIDSPEDLRKLPVDKLPEVCQELREDIVQELSVNPGHLASSLGVTELTVALHYVFSTPTTALCGTWDIRLTDTKSLQEDATFSIQTEN